MASQSEFKAEDYSRFFIREFLKKNGFDKTYDTFMQEDSRPKVTMTKNKLTDLLGLEKLMRRNSKTKQFSTMLDVLSNYLQLTKMSIGGIDLPESEAQSKFPQHGTKTTSLNEKKLNTHNKKQEETLTSQPAKTASNFFNAQKLSSQVEILNKGGKEHIIDDWDQDEMTRKVSQHTELNFYKPSSNQFQNPSKKIQNNFVSNTSQIPQQTQKRIYTANKEVKRGKLISQKDKDLQDSDDELYMPPDGKNQSIRDDDLDDLMQVFGGNQQNTNSNQSNKKQKAKVDESDPLAFLKRAEQVTKMKLEQKRLDAEEANTAYKEMKDLCYDTSKIILHTQKDDFSIAVQTTISGALSKSFISNSEAIGIKLLLFKSDKATFHDSWCQGFYFDSKLKYGIFQSQGGPCGILAAVQAFFLKHLLYIQQKSLTEVTIHEQKNLIASAIADILINASQLTQQNKVTLVIPSDSRAVRQSNQPIQPGQCTAIQFVGSDRKNILNAVRLNLNCFTEAKSHGVILLVYSVILTRGVTNLRNDMDLQENSLLNEFGYASQELINTMLVGRGASNVHDGDKDMGEGLILKGIQSKSEIGFLTFFEHYGYFQVGQNLKNPTYPIWIVCSESHYSVLFAVDAKVATHNSLKQFDLIYYDELARQEDDIILTVKPGKYVSKSGKQHTVPIDCVIRTKWDKADVNWNGRTVIL